MAELKPEDAVVGSQEWRAAHCRLGDAAVKEARGVLGKGGGGPFAAAEAQAIATVAQAWAAIAQAHYAAANVRYRP